MNERIKAIAGAATRLFLRQGYAKTQISHIAKAVGVSVGTIYLDFAGKREILHFLLKYTMDPQFAEREFTRPITDDLFAGLEDEIASRLQSTEDAFAAHLQNGAADYSFEAMVSDAFDLLSRYAAGCLFLEKNPAECPRLTQRYLACRRQFLDSMTGYLRAFLQRGTVRPLEHLELSAVLMIETLSWWAMDIRYTAFETMELPTELAKQVCMDNLIAAYRR